VGERTKPLSELAEDEKIPGSVTSRMAAFAKKNNGYVMSVVHKKKTGIFIIAPAS